MLKHLIFSGAILASILCRGVSPGAIVNEDSSQFFHSYGFPATEKGLQDYWDKNYLSDKHQIKVAILNVSASRASFAAKHMESRWDAVKFSPDGQATYQNTPLPAGIRYGLVRMKALHDANINPYTIWIEHLRKRNVSPWISIRMNDTHDAFRDTCTQSTFWKNNPQWRIAQYRNDSWAAQGLDYAVPEVRDYYRQFIEECIERFDADGIELDFMRFGRVFRPGEEIKNRELLTDMLRLIRKKLDARGTEVSRKLQLGVRVPATPEDAWELGYDVQTWCRENLVQLVVPSTFFDTTSNTIPVRIWRAIVGNDVILAPCLESSYSPYPMGIAWQLRSPDPALRTALSTQYYHAGADRIYFFNHFGNKQTLYTVAGEPASAAAAARRHAIYYTDFRSQGKPSDAVLPFTFKKAGSWGTFRLDIGTPPQTGRKAQLILGAKVALKGKFASARLNGCELSIGEAILKPDMGKSIPINCAYDIPDGLLQSEGNVIELQSNAGPFAIDWVEIFIPGEAAK